MRQFASRVHIPARLSVSACLFFSSVLAFEVSATVPDWAKYPKDQWHSASPAETGFDPSEFRAWVSLHDFAPDTVGGQNPGSFGVVLARGGYIVATWGDPDFKFQTASAGKALTRMCVQLAVDQGYISSIRDPIKNYWTGEGMLNGEHKYLDTGYHDTLTFSHLAGDGSSTIPLYVSLHSGGFPVSNGYDWARNSGVPSWAMETWTGDADADNYAHVAPGRKRSYSSGGVWRLSQALTSLFDKDLKDVLDEHIMSKIGISSEDWDWLSGEEIRTNAAYYPDMPGYGDFLDVPHEINGHVVRDGGGSIEMSAKDLARVALLAASEGEWEGEQLVSRAFFHDGFGGSSIWGLVGNDNIAYGRVTAQDLSGVSDPFHPRSDTIQNMIVGSVNVLQAAPVAREDSISTIQNTPVVIEVRASDRNYDVLTFSVVGNPDYGNLSDVFDGNAFVTYTPEAGYAGQDTFAFRAFDGQDYSVSATVTVMVEPIPEPSAISLLAVGVVLLLLGRRATTRATPCARLRFGSWLSF